MQIQGRANFLCRAEPAADGIDDLLIRPPTDHQPTIQPFNVYTSDIPVAGRHPNRSLLQIATSFSNNILCQAPDTRAVFLPRGLLASIRENIAAACRCMIGPAIQ